MSTIFNVLYYIALAFCILFLLAVAVMLHKIGTLMKWELEEQRKADLSSSEEVSGDA